MTVVALLLLLETFGMPVKVVGFGGVGRLVADRAYRELGTLAELAMSGVQSEIGLVGH